MHEKALMARNSHLMARISHRYGNLLETTWLRKIGPGWIDSSAAVDDALRTAGPLPGAPARFTDKLEARRTDLAAPSCSFDWPAKYTLHTHSVATLVTELKKCQLNLIIHTRREARCGYIVYFLCFCPGTDFSAEDKASGVTFCSAVHRLPRQGITEMFVIFAPPKAQIRTNQPARGPRPPACIHCRKDVPT